MIVGVLKEIKAEENRVCMTPAGVEIMRQNGHTVLVEKNAGKGSGFNNKVYSDAGAEIVDTPKEIFKRAKMVMHVKEPLPAEYDLIRKDQIIFTYLHLAAAEDLTKVLIKSGSISIAYETIQKDDGSLPLLTPMSEVAGRMAIQQGAKYLEMAQGGHGVLLGGVPGVDPGALVPAQRDQEGGSLRRGRRRPARRPASRRGRASRPAPSSTARTWPRGRPASRPPPARAGAAGPATGAGQKRAPGRPSRRPAGRRTACARRGSRPWAPGVPARRSRT